MSKFELGDMVVLASGSMRMTVESTEDATVNVVWCHEGRIGRDSFDERLLNKWEHREDARPARPPSDGPRPSYGDRGPRPSYSDRDRDDRGGGYRGPPKGGDDRGGYRGPPQGDDRGGPPRGKTGWDGRPREKKFYRKDD